MSSAEEFVEDLDAAREEVRKLQKINQDKVRSLGQMGKGIDPGSLANLKIDTFVESFLDEPAQLVYLRNLETRIRQALDEALAQVRQEQLVQGVTPPQTLIIPR